MFYWTTLIRPSRINKLIRREYRREIEMASDTQNPATKGREKVALKPGFHLVDWMRLMMVKEKPNSRKVSRAELASHASQFDCWTAYNGKVYDISQYVAYHPGGAPKIMQGAGKDCTALFNKFHSWVNIDSMLSKCLIGSLIEDTTPLVEESEDDDANEKKAVGGGGVVSGELCDPLVHNKTEEEEKIGGGMNYKKMLEEEGGENEKSDAQIEKEEV